MRVLRSHYAAKRTDVVDVSESVKNNGVICTKTSSETDENLSCNTLHDETHNGQECISLTVRRGAQEATAGQDESLKIRIINVNEDTPRINVIVRVYEEGQSWYTRLYHTYEGTLWNRYPRNGLTKCTKWYYKCLLCPTTLCGFQTMKSHLNFHLGFYPSRCTQCPKQYTNRSSLSYHRKTIHYRQ